MQRWTGRLIAVFLFLIVAQPVHARQAAGLRFRFAFGAVTGAANSRKLTRIAEDIQLKTGDKIKLMVEMDQPGFVYVIHRSPANAIDMLFPADLTGSVRLGRAYYMPEGTQWFELDRNTGDETFYVLGSTRRLSNLESLLARYSNTPAPGNAAITAEIVAEIRKLRAQNADASAQAERPVMIGGNVRSLDPVAGSAFPDVNTIAVEITAKDFYARTFTIEHQ